MPCTNCFRYQRTCVLAKGSSRCGECAKRRVACDGTNFAPALAKSLEGLDKLSKEEDELQERLLSVMRQKRILKARADELFRRGSLIVESDPASYSGEDAGPSSAGPSNSDDAGVPDFDWSALFGYIEQNPVAEGAGGSSGEPQRPPASAS